MTQNLVIVESPAKARTIEKYLGKDFRVFASYGHVRDLVPKEGAVDPDHDFAMKYDLIEKNEKHVQAIAKALADKTVQISLAQQMLEDKMTARDAENCVQELLNKKNDQPVQKKKEKAEIKLPPVIADIEAKLRSRCGTKVRIFYNEGKGRIEIDYYNNDDLDRIFNLFYQDEANDS